MEMAAVLIPVYRNELNWSEQISLQQCKKILNRYPVILVAPRTMKIESRELFGLPVERFPEYYFDGISGYNRLMLSGDFYQRFERYEYVLIYQLDAFVFSDRLQYFCGLGYDYIGAPWLHGYRYITGLERRYLYVGNGGFSLRKVGAFLEILNEGTVKDIDAPEDVFWASRKRLRIAPVETAVSFAFEAQVRKAFERNRDSLPFGCHAWLNYDLDFLRPYIQKYGYELNGVVCCALDEADAAHNPVQDCFDASRETVLEALGVFVEGADALKVALFGVGALGNQCYKILRYAGIEIAYCIDNDKKKQGKYFWEHEIISFDQFIKTGEAEKTVIIAAMGRTHYREVTGQMNGMSSQYEFHSVIYIDLYDEIIKRLNVETEGVLLKIIVFGVGKFYRNRKEQLASYRNIEIVAYADNKESLWGTSLDGCPVVVPQNIEKMRYDLIVIMSTYGEEIYAQLIGLGVSWDRIRPWEVFRAEMASGARKTFRGKNNDGNGRKHILVISTDLNYNGGSLAAAYAVMALKGRGYDAALAVPAGDGRFIEEMAGNGITVHVCPELPYICDMEWIGQFDAVVVNVFQMLYSAVRISLVRPTLWWIHESLEIFDEVRLTYWNCVPGDALKDIDIYAVSRVPGENFNRFYSDRVRKILHYGIPDMAAEKRMDDTGKEKLVFAIIGNVCTRKAQDTFCKAVQALDDGSRAEFWIIGSCGTDVFCDEVKEMCSRTDALKMKGLLTRDEIYRIFPEIDVVVCASREDPLPIVLAEGMMFGKACITTAVTGTADLIRDGENGFVIPADDANALKEKMEWILNNRDKLAAIGKNARKVYEQYFSLDVFGENLERALSETEREWRIKKENDSQGGV